MEFLGLLTGAVKLSFTALLVERSEFRTISTTPRTALLVRLPEAAKERK